MSAGSPRLIVVASGREVRVGTGRGLPGPTHAAPRGAGRAGIHATPLRIRRSTHVRLSRELAGDGRWIDRGAADTWTQPGSCELPGAEEGGRRAASGRCDV